MNIEQLEFPEMAALVAATTRDRARSSRLFAGMTREKFTVALMRSLAVENLSFTTYAIMLAIHSRPVAPTMPVLMSETGYSYHAVAKQVDRMQWFVRDYSAGQVRVKLAADAEVKLERIARRITAKVA